MAFTFKAFDKYSIIYNSEGKTQKPPYRVYIQLSTNVGVTIATLFFFEKQEDIPANGSVNNGIITGYYLTSDLPAIVDILRNESPLYISHNDANNWVQIRTSGELVGEEDN
jgi:hypothetical protein